MKTEPLSNHDYLFDDFILNASGVLSFHGQEISLPPKELDVLLTLLEADGNLVHKNFIIEKVWGDNLVGDESLTRCIYSLRRLLRESKSNKYIETVYGKGYRFSRRVTMVPRQRTASGRCKLAVFPFLGTDDAEAGLLHALLLDQMAQLRDSALTVAPAVLTRVRPAADDLLALCHQLELDLYLSGEFRRLPLERVLVVELVEASSQNLLWRETITLDGHASWSERLASLVSDLRPHLPQPSPAPVSRTTNEVLLSHVMARRCLRVRQPGDLDMALQYLQMGLLQDPLHIPSLVSLAETYMGLTLQGDIWPEFALAEARSCLSKALGQDPQHQAALAAMAWLVCLERRDLQQAGGYLQQAVGHDDVHAETYLYQAWWLGMKGDAEQSQLALNLGLTRDSHLPAALIAKLWLLHASGRTDDAVAYGLSLAGQYSLPPRFFSVLAVVLSDAGQHAKARAFADMALDMAADSLPEQIFHARVMCSYEPARARQRLAFWMEEARMRYRCPALLALLALDLDDLHSARTLFLLAHQQNCAWLPLVRISERVAAFLAAAPELEQCI
jgi:DNA-binding winged helix-turn-helix (wHTH) protein/tetratricopeptide (TPR) repeat protein